MQSFDTVFPADSVEFCPSSRAEDIFVCGTYNLNDNIPPRSQNKLRQGKCLVFELSPNLTAQERRAFTFVQEISLPAVLDMKWCYRKESSPPILAIADSEGNISLHNWLHDEKYLKSIQTISVAPGDVLCLSLDWSCRREPSDGLGSLVVSLSNGSLSLLEPISTGLKVKESWHAHDHEPWVAAWNYWNNHVVYSGGDDLKMKAWDFRQGVTTPAFTNRRFEAGITSIQSHPHVENIIAVGSYDSKVCLFDVRKPQVAIAQADVGGGAWRVKWHPSVARKFDLLVACMHDGFKVVSFDESLFGEDDPTKEGGWKIAKRFDAHASLAYGVDWSHGPSLGGETIVASCSFYDHALHLWTA